MENNEEVTNDKRYLVENEPIIFSSRKEDLELFRIVIFKIPERPILMDNILELYNNEPKLFEINSHIDSLEGYNKSIKYDKEFLKNQDI